VIAHRYLPAAREELIEAAAFYERAAVGLGDDFLDDVERAIETLQEHPRIGSPAGRRFRKLHIRRFPFNLIYADRTDEIVIVAVAHQRKRPGYWRRRQ
jgi:plasmid stabilization system protein ParE